MSDKVYLYFIYLCVGNKLTFITQIHAIKASQAIKKFSKSHRLYADIKSYKALKVATMTRKAG